jgi:hypothetical protein
MAKDTDNDAMLRAMAAEPERDWTPTELHELRGGPSPDATYQALKKLSEAGTISRPRKGFYRWAGARTVAAKPAKKAPAASPKAAPKKAAAQVARAKPAEKPQAIAAGAAGGAMHSRLLWLAGGHHRKFISDAMFINGVLDAIGFQG